MPSPQRFVYALSACLLLLASCGPALIGAGLGSMGGGGGGGSPAPLSGSVAANGIDGSRSLLRVTLFHPEAIDAGEDAVIRVAYRLPSAPDDQFTDVDLSFVTSSDPRVTLEGDRIRVSGVTRSEADTNILLEWDHAGDLQRATGSEANEYGDVQLVLKGGLARLADRVGNTIFVGERSNLGQETGLLAVDPAEFPSNPQRGPEDPIELLATYADFFGSPSQGVGDISALTVLSAAVQLTEVGGSTTTEFPVTVTLSDQTEPGDVASAGRSLSERLNSRVKIAFSPCAPDPADPDREIAVIPPGGYAAMELRITYSETPNVARAGSANRLATRELVATAGTRLDVGDLPRVLDVEINRAALTPGSPTLQLPIAVTLEDRSCFGPGVNIAFEGRFESAFDSFPITLLPDTGSLNTGVAALDAGATRTFYVIWDVVRDVGLGLSPTVGARGLSGFVRVKPVITGPAGGANFGLAARGPTAENQATQLTGNVVLDTELFRFRLDQITETSRRVHDNVTVVRGEDIQAAGAFVDDPNRTRDIIFTRSTTDRGATEREVGTDQQYAAIGRLITTPIQIGADINDLVPLDLNPDAPDALVIAGGRTRYVTWQNPTGGLSGEAQGAFVSVTDAFNQGTGFSNVSRQTRAIPIGEAGLTPNRRGAIALLERHLGGQNQGRRPIEGIRLEILRPETADPIAANDQNWLDDQFEFRLPMAQRITRELDDFEHVPAVLAGEFDGNPATNDLLIASNDSERPDLVPPERGFMHLTTYAFQNGAWAMNKNPVPLANTPPPVPANHVIRNWVLRRMPAADGSGNDDILLMRDVRDISSGFPILERIELFVLRNDPANGGVLNATWEEVEGSPLIPGAMAGRDRFGRPTQALPQWSGNTNAAGRFNYGVIDVEIHDIDRDGRCEPFLFLVGNRNDGSAVEPFSAFYSQRTEIVLLGLVNVRDFESPDPSAGVRQWRQLVGVGDVPFQPFGRFVGSERLEVSSRPTLIDLVDIDGDEELDLVFKVGYPQITDVGESGVRDPRTDGLGAGQGGELVALTSRRSNTADGTLDVGSGGGSGAAITATGQPAVLDMNGDGASDLMCSSGAFFGSARGLSSFETSSRGSLLVGSDFDSSFVVEHVRALSTHTEQTFDAIAHGVATDNTTRAQIQRLRFDPQLGSGGAIVADGPPVDLAPLHRRPLATDQVRALQTYFPAVATDDRWIVANTVSDDLVILDETLGEQARLSDVAAFAVLRTGTSGPLPPWRDRAREILVVASTSAAELRIGNPVPGGAPIAVGQDPAERVIGLIGGRFLGTPRDDLLVVTRLAVQSANGPRDEIRAYGFEHTAAGTLEPVASINGVVGGPVLQYHEPQASGSIVSGSDTYARSAAESLLAGPAATRFMSPVVRRNGSASQLRMRVARSNLGLGNETSALSLIDVDGDTAVEVFFRNSANRVQALGRGVR